MKDLKNDARRIKQVEQALRSMSIKEALIIKEDKCKGSMMDKINMNCIIQDLRLNDRIKEKEICFNPFTKRNIRNLKIIEVDGEKHYFINGKYKTFNQLRAYVNKWHFVDRKGISGEILIEVGLD